MSGMCARCYEDKAPEKTNKTKKKNNSCVSGWGEPGMSLNVYLKLKKVKSPER